MQFQTNDEQMPLDRATVRWSEEASPPVHVATLVIPQQNLDTRGQSTYGERLAAFTQRYSWVDPLHGTTAGQMEQRVRIFGDMALLEVRKGATDLPGLPPVMMVASFGPEIPEPPAPAAKPAAELLTAKAAPAEQPAEQLRRRAVAEAGWDSDEERKRAPLPVRHPKR